MDFKDKLEADLDKQAISSRILLDNFIVIDEDSRKSPAYQDPRFVPFYYHLGKFIQPKNLVELGFRLGFLSGCFLKSCKTVEDFLAFQEMDEGYNPRFGRLNINQVYKNKFEFFTGEVLSKEFVDKLNEKKRQMFIINQMVNYDKHREYLDLCWENLDFDGMIVMEYINHYKPAKQAFDDFCKMVNRDSYVFPTRHGTGVIIK